MVKNAEKNINRAHKCARKSNLTYNDDWLPLDKNGRRGDEDTVVGTSLTVEGGGTKGEGRVLATARLYTRMYEFRPLSWR